MPIDRKAELRKLRDAIAEGLIRSLAHLKPLGFRRQGRCWKRSHPHAEGSAIDLVEFELTVLKASVRVRMYEMQWVQTGRKTVVGTQTGRLETNQDTLEWKPRDSTELPGVLAAVADRLERVSLPWFASGGDPSHAVEVYPLDEFNPQNLP